MLLIVAGLALTSGCGYAGDSSSSQGYPDTPLQPNEVSLQPSQWYITYSPGMPEHPTTDSTGAWAFSLPEYATHLNPPPGSGSVGYVYTPFKATKPLHTVTITFKVKSTKPLYHVMDPSDHPPATFHLFFATQGYNLSNANDRWWGVINGYNNDGYNSGGYDLGSRDNQVLTMSIPLTPANWTNVYGNSDSQAFNAALSKVGWFGLTFGGQYYWGHGVAIASGAAQFILVNYVVN